MRFRQAIAPPQYYHHHHNHAMIVHSDLFLIIILCRCCCCHLIFVIWLSFLFYFILLFWMCGTFFFFFFFYHSFDYSFYAVYNCLCCGNFIVEINHKSEYIHVLVYEHDDKYMKRVYRAHTYKHTHSYESHIFKRHKRPAGKKTIRRTDRLFGWLTDLLLNGHKHMHARTLAWIHTFLWYFNFY